jgi:thioredoxin
MVIKSLSSIEEIPTDVKCIIDCHATWCGPCKRIEPFFKEMATTYTDMVFLKVDIDEAVDITEKYNINSVPTFLFINNGEEICRVNDASAEKIEKQIKVLQSLT